MCTHHSMPPLGLHKQGKLGMDLHMHVHIRTCTCTCTCTCTRTFTPALVLSHLHARNLIQPAEFSVPAEIPVFHLHASIRACPGMPWSSSLCRKIQTAYICTLCMDANSHKVQTLYPRP